MGENPKKNHEGKDVPLSSEKDRDEADISDAQYEEMIEAFGGEASTIDDYFFKMRIDDFRRSSGRVFHADDIDVDEDEITTKIETEAGRGQDGEVNADNNLMTFSDEDGDKFIGDHDSHKPFESDVKNTIDREIADIFSTVDPKKDPEGFNRMDGWERARMYLPEERKGFFSDLIETEKIKMERLSDKVREIDGRLQLLYGKGNEEEAGELKEELDIAVEASLKQKTKYEKIVPLTEWWIDRLGGDSRKNLTDVLSRYKIDEHSSWHELKFGDFESHYLSVAMFGKESDPEDPSYIPNLFGNDILRIKPLTEFLGIPLDRLKITEYGMGTGRAAKMIFGIAETYARENLPKVKKDGVFANDEERIREFVQRVAKNYSGIELIEKNVNSARILLNPLDGKYNVPEENLIVGDFQQSLADLSRSLPVGSPDLIGEKTHLSICSMRTIFYCIEEQQLLNFLVQNEANLAEGGLLMVDSVTMRRAELDDMRKEREREHLNDLKNFYPSLARKYAHDNSELTPEGVDLEKFPRYPIFDNTTGQGFYNREVITPEYLKYVIENNNLNLEVELVSDYVPSPPDDDESFRFTKNLGRTWIKENELEDVYRKIIEKRVEEGLVDPDELLEVDEDDSEYKNFRIESKDDIDALISYVGYHMVRGFAAQVIFIRKTKNPKYRVKDNITA
jgi:hypothetical protein